MKKIIFPLIVIFIFACNSNNKNVYHSTGVTTNFQNKEQNPFLEYYQKILDADTLIINDSLKSETENNLKYIDLKNSELIRKKLIADFFYKKIYFLHFRNHNPDNDIFQLAIVDTGNLFILKNIEIYDKNLQNIALKIINEKYNSSKSFFDNNQKYFVTKYNDHLQAIGKYKIRKFHFQNAQMAFIFFPLFDTDGESITSCHACEGSLGIATLFKNNDTWFLWQFKPSTGLGYAPWGEPEYFEFPEVVSFNNNDFAFLTSTRGFTNMGVSTYDSTLYSIDGFKPLITAYSENNAGMDIETEDYQETKERFSVYYSDGKLKAILKTMIINGTDTSFSSETYIFDPMQQDFVLEN